MLLLYVTVVVGLYMHHANNYILQVFNYLAGSLTRIFTTLQEVDDKLILYGFIAGFSLNVILAGQMLYYWNTPSKTKKQPARKQTEKPAAAKSTGASPKPSGRTPTTRRRG